jgi:predicted RNA polymerase sigma factor
MESNRGSQVACSLGPAELSGRGARWAALAARANGRIVPTESGLRLIFIAGHPAADQDIASELGELAELERDCCAFATWSVLQNGAEFIVDISANTTEGIGAVQAMFAPLSSG